MIIKIISSNYLNFFFLDKFIICKMICLFLKKKKNILSRVEMTFYNIYFYFI